MAKAEAIIVGVFLAIVVFVGGVLIGRLTDVGIDHNLDATVKQKLINEISLKEIDKHLRLGEVYFNQFEITLFIFIYFKH